MLAGDEQVWKEVQESLKKIEELKAQWSILFTRVPSSAVGTASSLAEAWRQRGQGQGRVSPGGSILLLEPVIGQ